VRAPADYTLSNLSPLLNGLRSAAGCPLAGCRPKFYPTVRDAASALGLATAIAFLDNGGQSDALQPDFHGILLLPFDGVAMAVLERIPDLATRVDPSSYPSFIAPDMGNECGK
jgi:hypothetical protein